MSSKSKQQIIDYYIIRGDKDKISKKHEELEDDMINKYNYELKGPFLYDRKTLSKEINSYTNWINSKTFCAKNIYTGMDTGYSLINPINNTLNTIIYSINYSEEENKEILDCVLVFREEQYEEDTEPYIDIISFCANQAIKKPLKNGGFFFEHFLNSLRDKYNTIKVSSDPKAYAFYKSFHFEDQEYGHGHMIRMLSPTDDNNRRRKKKFIDYEFEENDNEKPKQKRDVILKISELKKTWSNYKFTPFIARNYYIIRTNKYDTKHHNLEKHMIEKYKYKLKGPYDRETLLTKIESYDSYIEGFCNSSKTRQGGITTNNLTTAVKKQENTVIYSIENGEVDCVLVFCDEYDDGNYFIWVEAFCSNQHIQTKKGGIFFGYFLNSIREKYKKIVLDSQANDFYKSFYFSQNNYGYMSRSLSPKSATNRTRKHYSPNTITGNIHIIHVPSKIHSAPTRKKRNSKNRSIKTESI